MERPGTARHLSADLPPAEEDSASDATGSAERSPRFALPVPVGAAEPPEAGTEEVTEEEDMAAEPNHAWQRDTGVSVCQAGNSAWQFCKGTSSKQKDSSRSG